MISELESTALFQGVSLSYLSCIAEFCEVVELGDGDPLIAENDVQNRDLFVILEGKVEILSSGTKSTSNEIVLTDQAKEVFGEISWLTGASRTASIRSVGATNVIRIDGNEFSRFLEDNHDMGYRVMKNLARLVAQRMIDTNNLLKQILWNI